MNNKIIQNTISTVTSMLPNVIFQKIVETLFTLGVSRSKILELRCLSKNACTLIDRSCIAFKQLRFKELICLIVKAYPNIKDQNPSISLSTQDFKILYKSNPPKIEMRNQPEVWENPRLCLGPELLPIKPAFLEFLLLPFNSKSSAIWELCERLKGCQLSDLSQLIDSDITDIDIAGRLETVNAYGSKKTAVIYNTKLKIKVDEYKSTDLEIVIVKKAKESIGFLIFPKDYKLNNLESK